jgi:hypothetical protein
MSLMNIDFSDPTWTLPMGLLWTVLEPELAIIAANFPFLRQYVSKILPSKWSLTPSSWRSRKDAHDNFERLAGDNRVPLKTIGGGWIESGSAARGTTSSRVEVPELQDDDSEIRLAEEERDPGIKVYTKWSVTRT